VGFRFEISTFHLRFTKKQQSGPTNGGRIEGHVMVHRIGSVGGSMGQASSGNDGTCHRAPSGALLQKCPLPEPLPVSYSGGKNGYRLLMTAVSSVHALDVEPLVL